ncbi:RNA polymerase sigma factor [Ammoniphilus sp. 3BR4]|uniref:RNA polymerase sigma factor n=1 Tax=Ammoniphilus sp. 3BR4 TaxID=3158265 RepID=UPI0034667759
MYVGENQEQNIKKIYREYYTEVQAFLLFFTRDKNSIDDLTQEVFIRLYKALPSFEGRSSLKSWILSIAKNVAIDYYRKQKFYSLLPDKFFKQLSSKVGIPEEALDRKNGGMN